MVIFGGYFWKFVQLFLNWWQCGKSIWWVEEIHPVCLILGLDGYNSVLHDLRIKTASIISARGSIRSLWQSHFSKGKCNPINWIFTVFASEKWPFTTIIKVICHVLPYPSETADAPLCRSERIPMEVPGCVTESTDPWKLLNYMHLRSNPMIVPFALKDWILHVRKARPCKMSIDR